MAGFDTGLNALLGSGKIEPSNIGQNFLAGRKIGADIRRDEMANKLGEQRLELNTRVADRQDQQFQNQQLREANAQEAFTGLTKSFQPKNEQEQQIFSVISAQAASGDVEGAIGNMYKVYEKTNGGKPFGKIGVDAKGDGHIAIQNADGTITQQVLPGFAAPAKSENGLNISFGEGGTLSGINMGGNTPVSMPKTGKLAQGEMLVQTPEGGISAQPVPGSGLERDRMSEDKAGVAKRRQVSDVATSSMALIDGIKSDISGWNMGTTGAIASAINPFGTSDRDELISKLQPLRSNLATQAMEIARQGSASGATGFGALSERELDLLMSSVDQLNPNFPDQFWDGLNKVQYHFQRLQSAANGQDPGPWDASVYENAPTHQQWKAQNTNRRQANPLQNQNVTMGESPAQYDAIMQDSPNSNIPSVSTQAEFDSLPKGTVYMEDGNQFVK